MSRAPCRLGYRLPVRRRLFVFLLFDKVLARHLVFQNFELALERFDALILAGHRGVEFRDGKIAKGDLLLQLNKALLNRVLHYSSQLTAESAEASSMARAPASAVAPDSEA